MTVCLWKNVPNRKVVFIIREKDPHTYVVKRPNDASWVARGLRTASSGA
jgi:hypothetical protein